MSPETLRSAVDFCYTGALPDELRAPSALAALLLAANRFIMPRLQDAVRLRLMGTLKPKSEGLFKAYEAAKVAGDVAAQEMVRARCALM